MKIQIEKMILTDDGREALEVIQGLYPDSSEEEHYSILLGMAQEDAKLDYVITEIGATDALTLCRCSICKENIYMGIGWFGHRSWLKTDSCPKCNLLKQKRC